MTENYKSWFLIIIGFSIIFSTLIIEKINMLDEPIIKEVSCYDNHNNEIQVIVGFFSILVGLAFIIAGFSKFE